MQLVEKEYDQVSSKLSDVEAIMHRTKENVTLAELIASEGMKEMVKSLNADIDVFLEREQKISRDIGENAENMKLNNGHMKKILDFYKARMKENLNALNVGVLSEDDYKSLEKQIKNNALGSRLIDLQPEQDGRGERHGGQEDLWAPVVTGGHAAPVLQASEHDLDPVAPFVASLVVADGPFA